MPPLILPSGKLATLDGKPLLVTQEEFEACCCEGAPVTEYSCYGCTAGHSPQSWLVTFSGFDSAPDGCDTCEVLNNSFVLEIIPPTIPPWEPGDTCVWGYDFDPNLGLPLPVQIYNQSSCEAAGHIWWNGRCWNCAFTNAIQDIRLTFIGAPFYVLQVSFYWALRNWEYVWELDMADLPDGECDDWITPFNVPLVTGPTLFDGTYSSCGNTPTCEVSAYTGA